VSALYRLTLRSDPTYAAARPRAELASRLARVPSLQDRGRGLFEFGTPDEHGVMEVELALVRDGAKVPFEDLRAEDAATYNAVEVRVPRPWVTSKGPQVFALVFMMAEWNGWTVYDEQIESTLQKDTVLQGLVAMRRAQLDREGRGGPAGSTGEGSGRAR